MVISPVLTHDLHVQLGLVTWPDSEPSIKVKEEVARFGLTYQPEHGGTQETLLVGCEESSNHRGFYDMCICVCTYFCMFVLRVQLCFLTLIHNNTSCVIVKCRLVGCPLQQKLSMHIIDMLKKQKD